MKNINENQKVTLTLGQLKRLIREEIYLIDPIESGQSKPYTTPNSYDFLKNPADSSTNPGVKVKDEIGAMGLNSVNEEDSEERNPSLTMCDNCGRMFPDVDVEIVNHMVLCPDCFRKMKKHLRENTNMKISENQKITLTIGQLKRLVREANDGTGIVGTIATNQTVGAMKDAGVTPAQAAQWANGDSATRDAMAKDLGAKFGHPEVVDQPSFYNAVAQQSGGRLSPTGASNVVHRASIKLSKVKEAHGDKNTRGWRKNQKPVKKGCVKEDIDDIELTDEMREGIETDLKISDANQAIDNLMDEYGFSRDEAEGLVDKVLYDQTYNSDSLDSEPIEIDDGDEY